MNFYLKKTDYTVSSYPLIGLLMTVVCAIVLLVVGFLFCLVMKKKYGFTPNYFLNFKKSSVFKTHSNSDSPITGSSKKQIHGKTLCNGNYMPQQYQLRQVNEAANYSGANQISGLSSTSKNPLSKYNYGMFQWLFLDLLFQ